MGITAEWLGVLVRILTVVSGAFSIFPDPFVPTELPHPVSYYFSLPRSIVLVEVLLFSEEKQTGIWEGGM